MDLKVTADVHESNIYNARRILNRELKLAMDAAGVEIPFPQVTVHNATESAPIHMEPREGVKRPDVVAGEAMGTGA